MRKMYCNLDDGVADPRTVLCSSCLVKKSNQVDAFWVRQKVDMQYQPDAWPDLFHRCEGNPNLNCIACRYNGLSGEPDDKSLEEYMKIVDSLTGSERKKLNEVMHKLGHRMVDGVRQSDTDKVAVLKLIVAIRVYCSQAGIDYGTLVSLSDTVSETIKGD